jgi:hypothetical protein
MQPRDVYPTGAYTAAGLICSKGGYGDWTCLFYSRMCSGLPLDMSVLQVTFAASKVKTFLCYGSPVLPLDVSVLQDPAPPGHVSPTAAYAAAACVYLQQTVLPLNVSVLQLPVLVLRLNVFVLSLNKSDVSVQQQYVLSPEVSGL